MRDSQLKNIEAYPSGQQGYHPFELSENLRRDTCFPAVRLSSNGNMERKLCCKHFMFAFHQFCGQLAISEQFLLHNEAIGKLLYV